MTTFSTAFDLTLVVVGQTNAPSGPSMVGLPQPAQPAAGSTQAPGTPGGPPAGAAAPASPFGGSMMFIMLGMLGLMVLMSFWTNRKEQKKRQALMSSMGKGDRVQTLGGLIGTIQEVYEGEVVLKLEEGRVRVARSSIQTVLKSADSRPGQIAPDVEVKNSREKAAV